MNTTINLDDNVLAATGPLSVEPADTEGHVFYVGDAEDTEGHVFYVGDAEDTEGHVWY